MKPILFNTREVRAVLDGRMTEMRRVVKFPEGHTGRLPTNGAQDHLFYPGGIKYPHYRPGDILYVRETWFYVKETEDDGFYFYAADLKPPAKKSDWIWCPSTNMPKEAARIFLRVTNVSVTRLQDIITGDYKTPLNINREGLVLSCERCPNYNGDCKDYIADNFCRLVDDYIALWDSTVKKSDLDKYGWNANPWVWVISFERISKEEAYKNEYYN